MASNSFAAAMKVAQQNTLSSQKEALEAAKRRELALKRAREEQEKKERDDREHQKKLMLKRAEDAKKEEERRLKKEADIRQRREDAARRKALDEEVTNKLPLPPREGGSKTKSPSSYIVTNGSALTREEKRMARDPLMADKLKAARRTTVKKRKDGRLPGGAVNSQDPGPSGINGSPGLSARARMAAQLPTLVKLNTEKRDLRTIEQITKDLERNRMGLGARDNQVVDISDLFVSKKGKDKELSRPVSMEALPRPGPSNMANGRPSKPTASPDPSYLKAKTGSTPRQAVHPPFSTTAKPKKPSGLTSANPTRPSGSRSTSGAASIPQKRHRERSSSLESDFLDDDDDSGDDDPRRGSHGGGLREEQRDMIWSLMGKNRQRYANVDAYSDDEDMEVSAADLMKEDMRSARLARQEDAEFEAEERRREIEKKKRKMEGAKG